MIDKITLDNQRPSSIQYCIVVIIVKPTLGKVKKLNLGCGFDYRKGYINVDNFKECRPDILMDIEDTPWDFADDEFDYIIIKHVLEHVGKDYAQFRLIMKEIYRITKNGGIIEIHVPHFRHDTYWSDPTHVRAFTPLTFKMMSKAQNDEWITRKANYSMIAYDMEINFEMIKGLQVYDNFWTNALACARVTQEELRQIANEKNNVIRELQITLRAIKPFH